jgi:hypothetical protein
MLTCREVAEEVLNLSTHPSIGIPLNDGNITNIKMMILMFLK